MIQISAADILFCNRCLSLYNRCLLNRSCLNSHFSCFFNCCRLSVFCCYNDRQFNLHLFVEHHSGDILADSLDVLHDDALAVDSDTLVGKFCCNLSCIDRAIEHTCSADFACNVHCNTIEGISIFLG